MKVTLPLTLTFVKLFPATGLNIGKTLKVLRTSPPPSAPIGLLVLLGLPTFIRNLYHARHPILLRAAGMVSFVVASHLMSGFTTLGRLTAAMLCNEA